MVSLTFYGGIREIGGNQILLEDENKSLFFDFGFPFKRYKNFYEEYLKPRAGRGLLDPLTMGFLPPLKGIYRDDLQDTEIWKHFHKHPYVRELKGIKGVLLSHAHLDHSGYISFLKKEIPVYSSAVTAFIAKAVQDSGRPDFDQRVCYFTPCDIDMPAGWKQKAFLSDSQRPDQQRVFHLGDVSPRSLSKEAIEFWAVSPKTKGIISSPLKGCKESVFRLKCFSVDHSIPGATAWAVETSSGWVVYTGDLRLHGKKKEATQKFIKDAEKLKPRALIIEGSRVNDEKQIGEQEVKENLLEVVKRLKGKLIIADFGARNVERLQTFFEIAKEVGRQLVITDKDAYLLDALQLIDSTITKVTSKYICIYQETTASRCPDMWKRNIYEFSFKPHNPKTSENF
jgi:ribonuclease J